MDNVIKNIQAVLTLIGGALGYFIGGLDGLMIVLLVLMGIDYITGVMCGIVDKKLSSKVGFLGICRKVLILLMVGIANILDVNIIQTGSMLRSATLFFYISNEGLSVLENSAKLGLPIPQKIKDVLEQLHDKSEKDESEDKE